MPNTINYNRSKQTCFIYCFSRDVRILLIAQQDAQWLKYLAMSDTFDAFFNDISKGLDQCPDILKQAAMAALRNDWEEYEKIIAILELQES